MARNVVVPMLVIAGAGALVYTGIANPKGGGFAGLGRLLRGEPQRKAGANPATFRAAMADLSSVVTGTRSPTKGWAAGAPGSVPVGPPSGARALVISFAEANLGDPYRWGGNGPDAWDCSGLTVAAYKGVGVNLPRVSAMQALTGEKRTASTAQPGDLVFFGVPVHHVGIVTAPGRMIHAPKPGGVVRYEAIWDSEPVFYRDVIGTRAKAPKRKRKRKPRKPRPEVMST